MPDWYADSAWFNYRDNFYPQCVMLGYVRMFYLKFQQNMICGCIGS